MEKFENPFKLHDNATTALVMAGARAVSLATQTLAFIGDIKRHHPEAAVLQERIAREVLKDWGLAMPEEYPHAPTPPASTPELRWPPEAPAVPDVYRENYYHVREPLTAQGLEAGDNALDLKPEDRLVWTGRSYWGEGEHYMMRMSPVDMPGDLTTWVASRQLRPGDEIPEDKR